jgi:outer membrane protein W
MGNKKGGVMRKLFLTVFILPMFFVTNTSFAQKYQRILTVGYTGGYAISDINNFIKNKNFDGITIDGRYFIKDNISIGIATGWSSFKEKREREVYEIENGEISAVQTRYMRSVPLLLTAHYYFAKEGAKVFPYLGGGLGAYTITYEKWYGTLADTKTTWSFGVRPEAGIFVPITEKVGINANIRYNYAIYKYNEVKNFNYLEGMLGVAIYFW